MGNLLDELLEEDEVGCDCCCCMGYCDGPEDKEDTGPTWEDVQEWQGKGWLWE